jgi:hypothetical protein
MSVCPCARVRVLRKCECLSVCEEYVCLSVCVTRECVVSVRVREESAWCLSVRVRMCVSARVCEGVRDSPCV